MNDIVEVQEITLEDDEYSYRPCISSSAFYEGCDTLYRAEYKNLQGPPPTFIVGVHEWCPHWAISLHPADLKRITTAVWPEIPNLRLVITDSGVCRHIPTDFHIWRGFTMNEGCKTLQLPMLPKSEQHAILNKAASEESFQSFRSLPSAAVRIYSLNNQQAVPDIKCQKVMIKPELGARSIGLIIIDATVVSICDAMQKYSKEWFEPPKKETNPYYWPSEAPDKDKKNPTIPNGVVVNKGLEQVRGEGAEQLSRAVMQEFVDNVSCEYRLITGGSKRPVFISKRSRYLVNKSDYCVADARADEFLASNFTQEQLQAILEKDTPSIHKGAAKDICALFEKCDFQYTSVDLFVDTNGKWGIFEYSTEFSVNDWPREHMTEVFVDFYIHALKQAKAGLS